jgi:hypothetical protein
LVFPDENDVLVDVVHEVIQIVNVVVLQEQRVDLIDDVEMMIVIMRVVEVKVMEMKLDDIFEMDNDDDENVMMKKILVEDLDDVFA